MTDLESPATGSDHLPPRHRTIWASLSNPFAAGFALTLGGLVAFMLGVALSNLATVLIYVTFALFAALALEPVVRRLERHRIPRAWGIVTVSLGFALVMVGVLWLVIPTVVSQIAQFIRGIPALITDFQATDLYAWLRANFGDVAPNLLDQLRGFLSDPANIAAIGGGLVRVGLTIGTTISGLIVVIVLAIYFLASMSAMKEGFAQLAPARSRPLVASMTEEITDSIGSYMGGMIILASCNAVLTFILFTVLGLPFPLLMAVTALCITLIPLVGSVLFWIIGTAVALFSSPFAALVFAVVYIVYMQLEAYVLTPKVMSKTVAVPGSLVVIGAMVGGTLLGLLGALVAVPVTASILLIIKKVVIPKQDAKV